MNGKLTLITPPDFFENGNTSILFFHISDEEQDIVSKWLSKSNLKRDLNLYVYTDEPSLPWIFYAFNRCDYKYINLNNMNTITQTLSGYFLGRSNMFYNTKDENTATIISHINNNRVNKIENFLERILID